MAGPLTVCEVKWQPVRSCGEILFAGVDLLRPETRLVLGGIQLVEVVTPGRLRHVFRLEPTRIAGA